MCGQKYPFGAKAVYPRHGGPSLTEDLQTERERSRSVTYIYIFLHNAHNK